MKQKETLKKDAIDLANNLFHYENKNFSFIKTDNEIYFRWKDIVDFLEYNDIKYVICKNTGENERITLERIMLETNYDFRGVYQTPLTHNKKNTIFIAESGLYELILSSKKKEAKAFRKFITKELLPSLRKTGTNHSNNTVNTDISFIKSFYDDNNISDFLNTNVVYLIAIGIYNGDILIKYGKSSRIFERDFNEHKKTFGDQIKMLAIIPTDNKDEVETIFKKTIKAKSLDIKLEFNGKDRDELFVTNNNFTIEKAIELMQIITKKNPLKSIKEKDERIKELQFQQDNEKYVLVAKEKTKQMELELKKQEEKTKQIVLQIQLLEMQQEIKKSNKEKSTNNNKDLYLQFLNECTKETKNEKDKIHCVALYSKFKIWFEMNNPNTKIPSNKEFVANLRKQKIIKDVKINGIPKLGIKGIILKDDNCE
jgi:prophage antirepressor-like protein